MQNMLCLSCQTLLFCCCRFFFCQMSPDGYIQMVLQAAYFRDSGGKFALTYEAASTRLFRNGRTETIRTLCEDSVQAVR